MSSYTYSNEQIAAMDLDQVWGDVGWKAIFPEEFARLDEIQQWSLNNTIDRLFDYGIIPTHELVEHFTEQKAQCQPFHFLTL